MKHTTNSSSSSKRHPRVLVAMAWHDVGHMEGIARYAREKGWILQSVKPGQEHMLKPGEVDGVICQLHPDFPEHTRRVTALRVPKVALSRYNPRARLPRVEPDYVEAGQMVANHFLENTFRHILFLSHLRQTQLENTYYQGMAGVLAKEAPVVTQALSTIARHLSDPDLSVKRIVIRSRRRGRPPERGRIGGRLRRRQRITTCPQYCACSRKRA